VIENVESQPERKPLPPYLEQWARMSFEELKEWAAGDGSRWMRAHFFAKCLAQLGHQPFPRQAGEVGRTGDDTPHV
jgi:hypothetical protein